MDISYRSGNAPRKRLPTHSVWRCFNLTTFPIISCWPFPPPPLHLPRSWVGLFTTIRSSSQVGWTDVIVLAKRDCYRGNFPAAITIVGNPNPLIASSKCVRGCRCSAAAAGGA
ncbi:hypothetical protein PAAG_03911 [Paracoccidioides lutzii Pb01]|uniref:Uncharacterized protein n=1 Tax=Paracoccidioides lutzii (strain ATCC MYA-826 / Pb01) TaxID=502779 RepID=C1GZG7_PARBA|nr:hypothetical protein PAAG_03911 [Paracoccidioides lutzii Pb01]EEH41990.2 hypothetical protein PAAG_03911 [Paracoccidioides lutzii Pb01]